MAVFKPRLQFLTSFWSVALQQYLMFICQKRLLFRWLTRHSNWHLFPLLWIVCVQNIYSLLSITFLAASAFSVCVVTDLESRIVIWEIFVKNLSLRCKHGISFIITPEPSNSPTNILPPKKCVNWEQSLSHPNAFSLNHPNA